MTEESATDTHNVEDIQAALCFLSLFPSISKNHFQSSNIHNEAEFVKRLNDGVLLFDALADVAPSYFDASTIARDSKDNYLLKQANLRKILRNLRLYLRHEHKKQIRFSIYQVFSSTPKCLSCNEIFLLLELLAAVAVICSQRVVFVGGIREMVNSRQVILKQLIQRGLAHLQDASETDEENNQQRNDIDTTENEQDGNSSLDSQTTIDRTRHDEFLYQGDNHNFKNESILVKASDDSASHRSKTVPGDRYTTNDMHLFSRLQMELADVQKLNETLEKERKLYMQRENELLSKLSESTAKHKAALMQVESSAMVREQELMETLHLRIAELETDLKNNQTCISENNHYKQQIDELRDEIDILKHANDKAIQTEEQLKRLKARLETLSDVQDCLKREEKAHSETVEKCIRLESEVASLQPLRRQLDDYKGRLVEVEIKLAEYEQENSTLRTTQENLLHQNAALQRGTYHQKEEELALRRLLASNAGEKTDDFTSVGTGLSELNPELKTELVRLRSENERLKIFASKRENDEVLKMEGRIEDLNLLVTKLKDQYLTCKEDLKVACSELNTSRCREQEVRAELSSLQQQYHVCDENLKATCIQLNESHSAIQQLTADLSSLHNQLDVSVTSVQAERVRHDEECKKLRKQHEDERAELVRDIANEKNASRELQFRHETEVQSLKLHHQENVDAILKHNEDERRSLIEKGKQMIKKHVKDHEVKIKEMESKCTDIQEHYEEILNLNKKKIADFENEAKTKLTSSQKAYQSCLERQRSLEIKCEELDDRCNALQREKCELEKELDRQRRRRVGVDNGQGYLQYERLQREIQTILHENRTLKERLDESKRFSEYGQSCIKPADNQSPWDNILVTSSSSLAELRSGYEETIASLTDEKRELIMKNAAAMAESKKAQQQAWELEETVGRLNDELTSVRLKLERVEHV